MKKCFVLLLWVVVITVGVSASPSNKSESIVSKRIDKFTVRYADMHLCLQRLSFQNKVPIGLEMLPEIKDSSSSIYFDIDVKDLELAEVLDKIVASDSRYTWKLVDETINVFPKESADTFLDVILPEFQYEDATRATIMDSITHNEHFIDRTRSLGLSSRTIMSGSFAKNINESHISISRQDASVREILNEMIKQDSQHYWVAQIYTLSSGNTTRYYMLK